jgi:hypothetical protein
LKTPDGADEQEPFFKFGIIQKPLDAVIFKYYSSASRHIA